VTRPPNSDDPLAPLWEQWWRQAGERHVDAALREIFDRVDAAVAERQPICEQSGRCCRFDQFGHLLYVTGLETAWTLRHAKLPSDRKASAANVSLPVLPASDRSHPFHWDACPFQVDGLCSIHTIRPTGCRIFFCDPTAETWQRDLYESTLRDLRTLHERFAIDYRYVEWRTALKSARRAGVSRQ